MQSHYLPESTCRRVGVSEFDIFPLKQSMSTLDSG